MEKLNVKALGLSTGIIWGAAMFLLGLTNMVSGWGSGIEQAMATLYFGYKPTVLGSIIGGIWGFFDAGIGGVIVAWLYNKLSKQN
jgi:hypothetical protein